MKTIEALQQVYIRLEPAQSPKGFDGYQTLFHTEPEISKGDAEVMEQNFGYFAKDTMPPSKRVLFRAPSGDIAAAYVARLAEPDSMGRARYMAHNLVLPLTTLVQAGISPLAVFEHFSFLSTVDGALAAGDPKTGTCPAARVDVPEETEKEAVELARAWSTEELRKLAELTFRHADLAQNRLTLAIAGTPEQIWQVLKVCYLMLPAPLYAGCMFDTCFVDGSGRLCNLLATYYWAVGVPKPQNSPKCIPIDAGQKTVGQDRAWQPATVYEGWLEENLMAGRWDQVARYKNHVFALSQFCQGESAEPAFLEKIPEDIVRGVFGRNPNMGAGRVRAVLTRQTGANLAHRLTPSVMRRIDSAGLFRKMMQGFEAGELLSLLYLDYVQGHFARPPQDELSALANLLEHHDHPLLRVLYAAWAKPKAERQEALTRLSDDAYQAFIQDVFKASCDNPIEFLDPRKAEIFVEAYSAHAGMARLPLPELFEALAKVHATTAITRLTPLVARQPKEYLKALRRIANNQVGIPAAFTAEVELAWDNLAEQSGGVKGFFMRWKR